MGSYKTLAYIENFITAIQILIPAILVLRVLNDAYNAYDEEAGLKDTIKKMKKRIFAAVIGIGSSSIIAFFKAFY